MIISNKFLSRRTMLKGLGVSMALPFLDSMVPAMRAASSVAPVRRLGVFYVPNGMSMPYWFPKTAGPITELPATLTSLQDFKDRVLLIGGLADEPANQVMNSGDHARSAGTFLTGLPFQNSGTALHGHISMDQVIARELSKETQLGSIELGIESNSMVGTCDGGASCAYTNTIAWSGESTPLPIENDPRAVFERLFGTAGSTDPAARQARMQRDQSILDYVSESASRINKAVGNQDKQKVGEYFESVRDIERRIQMAESQNSRELPVVDQPVGIPTDYAKHAELMMDLLLLAFQTDMTRISTFMLAREVSAHSYPEIGVSDSHHPLSHHQDEPAKLERLHKVNEYHFRQVGYLVKKLAATKEGSGTMLDHTLLMHGTGISDSNTHFHDDLPIALIGGTGTGLVGGRYIRQPKGTPLSNLYVKIINDMGVPTDKFGDSNGRLTLA